MTVCSEVFRRRQKAAGSGGLLAGWWCHAQAAVVEIAFRPASTLVGRNRDRKPTYRDNFARVPAASAATSF